MKDVARRFNAQMDKLVPAFRREIAQEKNRYIRAAAESYKRHGMLNDDLLLEHEQKLNAILRKNYLKIFRRSVDQSANLAPALKSLIPKWEIKRDKYEDYLRRWYVKGGGDYAFEIAKTTQNDMRRLMRRAFESELPETQVIQAGLSAMGLSRYRADTIARTETHKAAMFASQNSIKDFSDEAGLEMEKEWNAVNDERTRIDHSNADGQKVAMDSQFNVGGELMDTPADPSASLENIINCRCVMTYSPAQKK